MRAKKVKVKRFREFKTRSMVFSPEEAKAIMTPILKPEDAKSLNEWDRVPPGSTAALFQRKRSQAKVSEIVRYLEAGLVFTPVMLADIDGKKTYCYVDGQHRGAGHIMAGVPLQAFVAEMTMDEACSHFMVHNSKSTRVPTAHLVDVSKNPSGLEIKALAKKYGVENAAVHSLMVGVMSGASSHGPNLVDAGAKNDRKVVARAEAILDVWSNGKLWSPRPTKGEPEYWYSHHGVLKALAILVRKQAVDAAAAKDAYTIDDMVEDLRLVRDNTPWESSAFVGNVNSGKSHSHVVAMAGLYKDVLSGARDREAREFRRQFKVKVAT